MIRFRSSAASAGDEGNHLRRAASAALFFCAGVWAAWAICRAAGSGAGDPTPVHSARRAIEAAGASPVETNCADAGLTTRFKLVKDGGRSWLVSPDGDRFFSRGVCVFDQGTPRSEYSPERPSYAAWRRHASAEDWATASLGQLRACGFTTIGGWGEVGTHRRSPDNRFWVTPVLSLGANVGAPWFDMWDAELVERMRTIAREKMAPYRGDDRVIGYYSDNELGWWNATLWKMTLEQPSTSGQRRRLIELARSTYHDDWLELSRDFEIVGAGDWNQLDERGALTLRPGGDGAKTMRRFLGVVAERYYELAREMIRENDPHALVLGDRYQSFYYPDVAAASARHVDVVSTNLNAQWNDGTFLRSYLDSLHRLTGKPVLISEIYMSAADNRSGCPNDSGVYPVVANQSERATAAATTMRELAALPYVVGIDWFQYYDEPPHGRFDGENYNFGLVDLDDRPYEELTAALRELDLSSIHREAPAAPKVECRIPPAPPHPFADPTATRIIKSWDRRRGYLPAATETPLADLYVCWDAEAIYVAVYFLDIFENAYYQDSVAAELDRARWTIEIGGRARATIRIGAGGATVVDGDASQWVALPGSDHKVANVAVVAVPANAFGVNRLHAGERVAFHSSLQTFARAEFVEWQGELRLAD